MSLLCYTIDNIPDLSLNKYQSLADTGIQGVLKRHENFLRQWHGICKDCNTSFHLLYVCDPSETAGKRLRVFFILQGEENDLRNIAPLMKSSPLSDFYKLNVSKIPNIQFNTGATLIKKERVADIFNPLTGQTLPVHYVPKWEINEDARLYDLFNIMKSICSSYQPSKACAYRIDLYPTSLVQETRASVDPVLKSLRGENDIKLLKELDSIKSDSYAKDVCKEYDDWLTCIETTPHFRVNIYGFADSLFKSKAILNAAGAEAINEGDFSIAPIKPDNEGMFNLLSRMGRKADTYCFFPTNASLKTWSTTFSLNEAVPFFRFPVLYDGEAIEIPKETAPVQIKDGLHIGVDTHGYPVNFYLKDLPRHAFFTGMPGSGKTNTMLHLVTELKKHNIPFLALEPAKKEYRALLGHKSMENVFLFSPHLQSRFPLLMNPMDFPRGVMLSEHIDALLEVFKGSFILEGPTYKCLSDAIVKAYEKYGWEIDDINTGEEEKEFPNLRDVYDNLQTEIDAYSYDSEIKGNIKAFLEVRLGGLMERNAGELFNTRMSTLRPDEWISNSAIVELEVLGEEAKNFFVLLVCHYILETLRADPNGGVDSEGNKLPVRHVIFIEEAHNIIAPSTEQLSADSVDPKISATAYIIKMLAEVRALRESIIIADQLPTALADEVTKNTGLKLVHRLTSQDDRGQIGTAISASPLQLEQMASFTTGKAFIYHERTVKPFEVQVAEWESPEAQYDISNDKELYNAVMERPTTERSVMAALYNWIDKYLLDIESRFQKLEEQYDSLDINRKKDVVLHKSERLLLLTDCSNMKKRFEKMKKTWNINEHTDKSVVSEFEETEKYIDSLIECISDMSYVD